MRIITGCQLARVRQGGELPVEGELPVIEGAAEQRQELAQEHAAEHAHREEEPGLASEPLRAVKRQPAAWHDTVDVRVVLEGLPRPASRAAWTQTRCTDRPVMWCPGTFPGKSQSVGRATFQYSRSRASRRGDSIT